MEGSPGFDPSYIISHRYALEDAPQAYEQFNYDKERHTKIIFKTRAA